MKRVIFTAGIFVLMLAANVSFAQTKTKKTVTARKTVIKTTTTVGKKPSAADLDAGKALLAKSDCLSCHKVDTKVIGPAYIDVAKKYPANEANYEKLADKVIAGGAGNWGTMAMTPHPQLAKTDVKKMVQYILSLK